MIAGIGGTIQSASSDRVEVLTASGVAYEIRYPTGPQCPFKPGREGYVSVLHVIGQDDQVLFGFKDRFERALALAIMNAGVDRIGPTIAHRLVATLGAAAVTSAISRSDAAALARIKGLSKPKAEEIVKAMRGSKDFGVAVDQRLIDAREVFAGLGGDLAKGEAVLTDVALSDPTLPPAAIAQTALRRLAS